DVVVEVDGGADLVQDAAAALPGRVRRACRGAVRDGQTGDGHGRVVADVKDAAGVVAADGQLVGARPVDGHAAGEIRLGAGEGGGAGQAGGAADGGAGGGIGGGPRSPQRAGAAVVEVGHGEGAGQPAVFQSFECEPAGSLFTRGLVPAAVRTGTGA